MPLYQAIRATISIPGVFAPYEMGGRYYIDGGILERVPVQAVKMLGADIVIGVDVLPRGQEENTPPRNVVDTLQRTLAITDWHITRQKDYLADLLLLPDVYEGIDPYSSKDCRLCVQRGREETLKHIDEICALVEQG
ncbi:MAG: patatin-like phospholipase family protein, partial [Clostridiales bacterium]|nr:patatin-like phospholipase family protein [Clostridiales bacterium]